MKTQRSETLHTFLFLSASLTLLATSTAEAGFQYAPQDAILGIRKSGGGSELTVNIGSVSNLISVASGQTISIANLSGTQLSAAFADLNDLFWSVSADIRTDGNTAYPRNTLWVTRARADLATQTTPWDRRSTAGQGNTAAKISGIGDYAVAYGNSLQTGANNTSTGIITPAAPSQFAYGSYVGASGDFLGTFPGSVEAITASDFTTAGQSIRADFYQLLPGTGSGTYLGYFEFKTDGTMTYTAASPDVVVIPAPSIVSIDRTGTTNTITFTTVIGGNYTLRYSDDINTAVSGWTPLGSAIPGDGSNKSVSDITAGDHRFYVISAQ